jgi:PKD repeat protein
MQKHLFTAAILVAVLAASPLIAANKPLQSAPSVVPKETNNVIEVVKTFLTPRTDHGMVKIWAFFTDKHIYTDRQFADAASKITLTDAARSRRAKMGLDKITFGDIPVYRGYIDQITAMGAKLRRASRWLNAASFEIPLDEIDAVNNLPFVAKVRPVALFVGQPEPEEPSFPAPSLAPSRGTSLNYGTSLGQLSQINVPAVHDKGFDGAGIIVAMFDTGYRKDHQAFEMAYSEGRVLAEWDFIFNDGNTENEAQDASNQHNHGTLTWSTLGGEVPGVLYGPAYGASFILAKTEYVPTETQVEEDNWAAAVEWADSIGASVISSSLSYSDWYTYSDYDGETCVTTIAANLATSYGIVVANAMGNSGPGAGTLGAPADALEILSCGAVNSSGTIASFSSRGPTADGRIKPEVCAQGVSTFGASASSPTSYGYASGTSLSTPLIAGCAAVLLSARPTLTPQQVRMAFMQTASQADNPDNTYGWGIIDLDKALSWGAHMAADIRIGNSPLTVSFIDSSYVSAESWLWDFGDGDSSTEQNPTHTYDTPGAYDVSLSIMSDGQTLKDSVPDFVVALADTLTYSSDTVYAGEKAVVDINLKNSQTLQSVIIPFDYSNGMNITYDSSSVAGTRADGFTKLQLAGSSTEKKFAILVQHTGTPLPPGDGPVLRFYFTTDPYSFGNQQLSLDTSTIGGYDLKAQASGFQYVPAFFGGNIVIRDVMRGDANHDETINVGDPVYLINYIFRDGPEPISIEAGDANTDFMINISDAVYLVNYIFKGGPAPNDP